MGAQRWPRRRHAEGTRQRGNGQMCWKSARCTVTLCKRAEVSIQKLRLKYKTTESYGYKEKCNMTLSESGSVSMSQYESYQKKSQKESERSYVTW